MFSLALQPFIFSPPQVRVGVSAPTATPLLPAANKGTPPQLAQSVLNESKGEGKKMAAKREAGKSSSPEVVALSSDDEEKEEKACAVDLTTSPEEDGKSEQKSLAVSQGECGRCLCVGCLYRFTLKP